MSDHPGKTLQNFLNNHKITVEQLAENIDTPVQYLYAIVLGQNWIDSELAYKLGVVFDNGMKFWVNLQTKHDIQVTKERLKTWNPKDIYIQKLL